MSVNHLSNTSRTDWDTLLAMTDEEIDYSDIPPLTDQFFENATLRIAADKACNLIESDFNVITASFKDKKTNT